MTESNMEFSNTAFIITNCPNNIGGNLLHQKSRHEYGKNYALFKDLKALKENEFLFQIYFNCSLC